MVVGHNNPIGIEVKDTDAKRLIVVSNEKAKRRVTEGGHVVDIFPWKDFLDDLWSDKILGISETNAEHE